MKNDPQDTEDAIKDELVYMGPPLEAPSVKFPDERMKALKDYSITDHPAYGSSMFVALSIGFLIGFVVGGWTVLRSDPDAPTHEERYGEPYKQPWEP